MDKPLPKCATCKHYEPNLSKDRSWCGSCNIEHFLPKWALIHLGIEYETSRFVRGDDYCRLHEEK